MGLFKMSIEEALEHSTMEPKSFVYKFAPEELAPWLYRSVPSTDPVAVSIESLSKNPDILEETWGFVRLRDFEWQYIAGKIPTWERAILQWLDTVPQRINLDGVDKPLMVACYAMTHADHTSTHDVFVVPLPLADLQWCPKCKRHQAEIFLGYIRIGDSRKKLAFLADAVKRSVLTAYVEPYFALTGKKPQCAKVKLLHTPENLQKSVHALEGVSPEALLQKIEQIANTPAEKVIDLLDDDDAISVTLLLCGCGDYPTYVAPFSAILPVAQVNWK